MKKREYFIFGVVVIVLVLIMIVINTNKSEGSKVIIYIGGKAVASLDLDKNTSYTIEGEDGEWNTLVIEDGYVNMMDASCPDKLCVHHKRIHFNKETIVCLPNKVVLEIAGGTQSSADAVVN